MSSKSSKAPYIARERKTGPPAPAPASPIAYVVHPFVAAWRESIDDLPATTRGVERWFAAARWRRAIEPKLSNLALTFTQWLVLEATRQIIAEQEDATSQALVAARLEMDRMTLSQAMRALEDRGLVDRGPCFTGPSLRIWVTDKGMRALEQARASIEDASSRALRRH